MGKIDMILKSNAIFTGAGDDVISGAVLIEGNKIAGVVSAQEAEAYKTEDTVVYEYEDKLIMPGLVDGHDHLWWGAVANSDHMVDVTPSRSEEECVQMIREYAESHPDEKRVLGFGWFPANWNDAPLPTKISLDEAVPDRPAYMLAADAHTCWLNSKALEESGYTPDMKVGGGSIGVFENGEMNGLI
ncbi:MAG: amidohydrolase family protein, partial [Firmicutes bacterium]|nr:amidohydrolase family protein [Bacillota bacterium]